MSKPEIKTNELLSDLGRGSLFDAFEAAKSLRSLARPPVKRIINILEEAAAVHNREAAAYALSWLLFRKSHEHLDALLGACNNADESPVVRAQALEGFGVQGLTKRHKLWPLVEKAILDGLADAAVEVRFWACYAAGTLRVRAALPKLRMLAHDDDAVCPQWWRVSEEAADAIEWIFGRETPTRTHLSMPVAK
jgi:hypothetical protein